MTNKTVERTYHVVAVNEKTGKKEYLTRTPENHDTACTLLKKFSKHPARRVQLQEVSAMDIKETTVLKAYCQFAGWQGGPIIERESICIDKFVSGVWSACHRPTDGLIFAASNALTAAMRVYVISKLGGTVEIPDQLLK